jgi:hypothetical protein
MKKSFIIHLDSLNVLDQLTDEQSGQLFKAIHEFHKGNDPELDFGLRMAFLPFKNQFIRDLEKYESKVVSNRENGKKGGRPKKPTNPDGFEETQPNPKNLDNDNESENDNESKNGNIPIDFESILTHFNFCFTKKSRIIPANVKRKYHQLIRDGFTIDDIKLAMTNASRDTFHVENKFKYCSLEFFSRADKIDKFANQSNQTTISVKYIPTL